MRRLELWVLALLCVGTMGCSTISGKTQELSFIHYPDFFSSGEAYHSIAVAPVRNTLEPGVYTNAVSERLIQELNSAEYYLVSDHTGMNEDDEALLDYLYQTGSADLALFCTLTDYGESFDDYVETEEKSEDVYAVDEDGQTIYDENGAPVIDHTEYYEIEYTVYKKEAYASVYVQLVDVRTGESLMDSYERGTDIDRVTDPDDFSSTEDGRRYAARSAIGYLVHQISPTKRSTKIKEDDVMSLTHRNEEGYGNTYSVDDTLVMELKFPEAALYNTFKYDIVDGSDNIVLFSDSVYWDGNEYYTEYPVSELLSRSNGNKKFEVRLWNGENVLFSKKIKVKKEP